MNDELQALAHRLEASNRKDRELDGELARVLGGAAPGTVPADYTSSVDRSRAGARRSPGWDRAFPTRLPGRASRSGAMT